MLACRACELSWGVDENTEGISSERERRSAGLAARRGERNARREPYSWAQPISQIIPVRQARVLTLPPPEVSLSLCSAVSFPNRLKRPAMWFRVQPSSLPQVHAPMANRRAGFVWVLLWALDIADPVYRRGQATDRKWLKTRVRRGACGMTLRLMEATDRLWRLPGNAGTVSEI